MRNLYENVNLTIMWSFAQTLLWGWGSITGGRKLDHILLEHDQPCPDMTFGKSQGLYDIICQEDRP